MLKGQWRSTEQPLLVVVSLNIHANVKGRSIYVGSDGYIVCNRGVESKLLAWLQTHLQAVMANVAEGKLLPSKD